MVLVEHLLLRRAVKNYYATHLPHYDSIGSYTFAYDVLNAYANEGYLSRADEGEWNLVASNTPPRC